MRDPRAASIFATLIAVTHHLNGLNFVAVDFETANTSRASLCSARAVRVRDGIIVESFSTLVKRAREHNFSPSNVRVHGITADHIETAPTRCAVREANLDARETDAYVGGVSFDASQCASGGNIGLVSRRPRIARLTRPASWGSRRHFTSRHQVTARILA